MSLMTLDLLLKRIAYAPPDSPIAVLRGEPDERGRLNAVFAATAESQRLIRVADPALLGVWHAETLTAAVREALAAASRESQARWQAEQAAATAA